MGYAREFNYLNYNVPNFILQNPNWEDSSWHNDVCPRWENKNLGIAVWVDNIDPEQREFNDWKQYTIVKLIEVDQECNILGDDTEFSTEQACHLEEWVSLWETKLHLNEAFISAGCCDSEDGHDIADELAILIAETQEAMDNIHDEEIPDYSPAGELG